MSNIDMSGYNDVASRPVELLPPGEAVHGNDRWYKLRRQGITASEIAIVLGISPYGSPFSLYWQKVNDWRDEGNVYTSAGRHLEDAIADWWFAECDPLENVRPDFAGLYAHPERRWQLATPDRLIYGTCPGCGGEGFAGPEDIEYGQLVCQTCHGSGNTGRLLALLECKWVAYSWDGWGEPGSEDVPVYYRAQALWQLDVLGVDEVHIAALGPGGFRAYRVERDEDDLKLMRAAGLDFHRRIADQDPPPLDSHTATLGALKRLHPLTGEGDVEVSLDLAERYRKARADKKAAEEAIDLCEAQIRAALGSDHNRAVRGGKLVASRSVYERKPYEVGPTTIDKLNPGRADSYA